MENIITCIPWLIAIGIFVAGTIKIDFATGFWLGILSLIVSFGAPSLLGLFGVGIAAWIFPALCSIVLLTLIFGK
ncbi:MAG: hypothetical protein IJ099_02205 [Alphaproteobacteria bacterium]|nr:hypothetical protein [Alphaproteobacteria bacterium]